MIWKVSAPVPPTEQGYKYRAVYARKGVRIVGFDNERGKGDHRHFGTLESGYRFSTPEQLIADFQTDIARWNDENSGS